MKFPWINDTIICIVYVSYFRKGENQNAKMWNYRSRTNQRKPNLQVTSINVNGTPVKVKVCSRTLKTLKGLNDVEVMKFLKANEATLSTRLQKAMAK